MKGKVRKQGKSLTTAICATLALGVLGLSSAQAEYVPCDSPFPSSGIPLESIARDVAGSSINATQFVYGTNLSVSALSLSGPGTLTVKLADIAWPEALSSLSLLVTDLNGIWQRWEGQDLLIDIEGPTRLFAAVFASSSGATMPGLYQLRADFAAAAPVPLPAAVWLLLSAVGGLAAFKRKR